MRSIDEQQNRAEHKDQIELQVLSEVQDNSELSQRQLSDRVGIALGLTNVLVRSLIQKGYIRATHSHWKRWMYALTPEGVSRKVRLTISYVNRVLGHYQAIRQTLRKELEPLALNKESRIAILGVGDFAELIYLGIREIGIEEISIFSSQRDQKCSKFLGMDVQFVDLLKPDEFDSILIASLGGSDVERFTLDKLGSESSKVLTFFANGQSKEIA